MSARQKFMGLGCFYDGNFMGLSRFFQAGISAPPLGMNHAPRSNARTNKRLQAWGGSLREEAQPDPSAARFVFFYGNPD